MKIHFIQKMNPHSSSNNNGFKKLAVHWLNEVQFSNQTLVQVDRIVL